MAFQTMEVKRKYEEKLTTVTDDENRLMSLEHKVEAQ
jgi:hypothetical protein